MIKPIHRAGGAVALTGLILAPALVALLIGRGGPADGAVVDQGPVHSVVALRADLTDEAKEWVGRTILVRGEVVPCMPIPSAGNGPCATLAPSPWPQSGVDPARPAALVPLPLTRAGPDPWMAHLRRLPLLGALVPAPQALRWGVAATYRVQVRPVAHSLCGSGQCYEAVLLDAATQN
jgi:hypothetical protein